MPARVYSCAMSGRPIPPELDQPVPRRVKTNIWFKLTTSLLLIFPGAGLVAIVVLYGVFHDKAILRLAFAAFAVHAYTDNVLIATTACVFFAFTIGVFARAPAALRRAPGMA